MVGNLYSVTTLDTFSIIYLSLVYNLHWTIAFDIGYVIPLLSTEVVYTMCLIVPDPGCLIEVTKGKLMNIRNSDGTEVVTSILYNNFWIKYGNPDVKDR